MVNLHVGIHDCIVTKYDFSLNMLLFLAKCKFVKLCINDLVAIFLTLHIIIALSDKEIRVILKYKSH